MELPLVIDLDGTLLRSDLLIETSLAFMRHQPHRLLAPLHWLLRGKAALKHKLAHATSLDVSVLPYHEKLIEFIKAERARGRRIVLATASHRQLADAIATHLGLFDEVLATEANRNLAKQVKRDLLVETFGERGFDYAGNSGDDLPVWGVARQAYVVNASSSIERKARQMGNVTAVLRSTPAGVRDWIKALRLHQWLKNLLLWVPLLTAHRYTELPLIADALLAFFCFGLCASSVYLLNDLLDLGDDRHHPTKRLRPFACGQLSIQSGLWVFPLLLIAAFLLAWWQLPLIFSIGLASYYVLTLAYSLVLKRFMVIDVITLAALYTLRIVVGAMTLGIPLSFWLLAFSMFMFLSLALVKRYAELGHRRAAGGGKIGGRGYFPEDLPMVAALGAASGYIAVMVLALYINDAHVTELYKNPEFIWLACPLLLIFISRMWMLAHRGLMTDEDPLIFAIRDRVSVVIGALVMFVFWAAT